MAWIKVESATPTKPEVLKLARLLGVSRDDAFGKAMRFWIWLDDVTVDGSVDGVTSQDVDAIVGAEGISDALVAVGWMQISEDGQSISVPNFDRHNGESAKSRGLKTKRQQKWRANNVDAGPSTKTSPEKRREEKNIGEVSPITPQRGLRQNKRAFVRPTIEEVREYCQERKNRVDPETWHAYYEANGWRVGRNPMKDWKSAIITWEKNGYSNGRTSSAQDSESIEDLIKRGRAIEL